MYRTKKFIATLMVCTMLLCVVLTAGTAHGSGWLSDKDWIDTIESRELYNGVTAYSIVTKADSPFLLERINIVEFDPKQSDLYIAVTNFEPYSNRLKTVMKTVEDFNAGNNEGKTAIAAVNGDLWMVSYAHARIQGRADLLASAYKAYANDPLVTQSLTIPRGFNVYKGEIISSGHITQETPYEGEFTSFGVLADGTAELGQPRVTVKLGLTSSEDTVRVHGINRLPATNAIIMYTDKGPISNYAIEDAYELIIDCAEDYTVKHGAVISGKIVGICKEGDADMPMQENRIIITARGSRRVADLEEFKVGDDVTISVEVKDGFGNSEFWQNVEMAVGGHMEFARDGKYSALGGEGGYPTTIIATTNSGKMIFLTADGRQSGYSVGIPFSSYNRLAKELDLQDAFIVDGGGSATMVQLQEQGYSVVNRPSDKKEDGSYGSARTVVNSIILSYGLDRNATPTPEPEPTPTADDQNNNNNNNSTSSSGSSLTGVQIGIIIGGVAVVAAIIVVTVLLSKKKK